MCEMSVSFTGSDTGIDQRNSKLVGEHQPGFTQGRPAQFGFLIDGELRMMKAALGLGAKCREVMTIDFGNVCHVSKLLRN